MASLSLTCLTLRWNSFSPWTMRKLRKLRVAKHLFVKDSPFKPKVIPNKKAYNRTIKHKGHTYYVEDVNE